jgi:hypothetical protein
MKKMPQKLLENCALGHGEPASSIKTKRQMWMRIQMQGRVPQRKDVSDFLQTSPTLEG